MSWHPEQRLLTIDEAAQSVGRPASTIRRWISEQRLTPHPTRYQGRTLILESDVLETDADTRRARARRTTRT